MKPKIVVLGGGMGSMAAVWELSHRPEIQERYDIVVYQQGWRLGGKAASGRNPDAHQRIEEHGLHVWMGFYQNAFRVVRECYTELTGDADEWKRHFVPHGQIALEQRWNGAWKHWHLDFPTRQQLVPGDATETPSPWQYVRRMLWMMAHMADDSPYLQSLGMPRRLFVEKPTLLRVLRKQIDRVDLRLGRMLPFNNGDKASDAVGELFTRVLKLAVALPEDAAPPDPEQQRTLVWLLDKLRQGLRGLLGRRADSEFEAFQMLALFDFGLTAIIGMIADGLLTPPYRFEAIDDLDFKEWLEKHGALATTRESAPVTALYDLVFSIYTGIAAGTTLICALRMLFSYSGDIFYKVRGGMGDVVFAPLYRALERRGVRFEFFHRVDALCLSPLRDRVERIELARQATLKNGRYEPLREVTGLPSWPSVPDWSQL
ncbi:MAG: NAD(P)-binding protein, partial [Polyangia bacterium]